MPDDNPILRHWQTELEVFGHNFSIVHDEMNVEAIHDMRVAIKKLRSYVKLCSNLYKKNQPEPLLAMLKTVFSVFGKHRNIDVVKELMPSLSEKNKPVPKSVLVYLQLLQDQVSPYCTKVVEKFKKDQFDKLTAGVKQELQRLNTAELENSVTKLIAGMIKTLKKDLRHFRKRSHLVRKQLKDIFYWSKLFDDHTIFTKSQLKKLDQGLDHLGNIQDLEVAVTSLKNFRKTIVTNSSTEYDLIKKMEVNARKKQDVLLEKANKITEQLIIAS